MNGHILRRSCLLRHIVKGQIGGTELMGRQAGRRKQLLDDLQEMRVLEIETGSIRSHCMEKLALEEAVDLS